MSYRYEWKGGPHPKLDVTSVGMELERLERESGITPENVVDAARNPSSVLHPAFDWVDSSAAESWRRQQARALVNAIVIVDEEVESKPIRAFVSVSTDAGREYINAPTALNVPTYRKQVLSKALEDARLFRSKYNTLREVAPIIAAIEEVVGVKAK